jgi:hypothetical protein
MVVAYDKISSSEYLVKWKGYRVIKSSWVKELNMEHGQEAIETFHNQPTNKWRKVKT